MKRHEESFIESLKDSAMRAIYRGPDEEIPSAVWDTIEILYKNAPLKPFIHTKTLLSTSESTSLKPKLPKKINTQEIVYWIRVRPKKKQTWCLVIHLPAGCDYSEFKSKEKFFATAVGGTCEIDHNGEATYMTISNIQLERKYIYSFDPILYLKKMKLPIFLGRGANGPVVEDLTEILTLLIVGLRGQGKSTMMHQIIYTLLLLNKVTKKEYVQVAIIGPKNKEFEYFEEYGAVFAHEERDYIQLLRLIDEADRERKNKLGQCRDILEYNSVKGNHMPFVVMLVDEVDVVGENKECRELLLRSVKKYRSQGIHVLAATQRPSARIWKGNDFSEFKSQFEARVAFRMVDGINSQMILESDKAAHLPKIPGRAIYKYDSEVEIQTPNFPSEKKDPQSFHELMDQLPQIPLPYHDIEGEAYDFEPNYPRPRHEARSKSSSSSRSIKMLKSGTNPFT